MPLLAAALSMACEPLLGNCPPPVLPSVLPPVLPPATAFFLPGKNNIGQSTNVSTTNNHHQQPSPITTTNHQPTTSTNHHKHHHYVHSPPASVNSTESFLARLSWVGLGVAWTDPPDGSSLNVGNLGPGMTKCPDFSKAHNSSSNRSNTTKGSWSSSLLAASMSEAIPLLALFRYSVRSVVYLATSENNKHNR